MSIAVLVSHPDIAHSLTHRQLLAALQALPDLRVRHLEADYPDGRIDVEAEQAWWATVDTLVLQFPFYWFATPPLLKAWLDAVLSFGWAYGPRMALRGKSLRAVISCGGSEDKYRPGGHNLYPVTELLKPLETTAHFVGMRWLPPLALYGVPNVPGIPVPGDYDQQLAAFIERYRQMLHGETP
ncbi:MAG: NAD(P)H-dependent oxidoreductase [Lysobacterales bacterium]